VKLLVGSWSSLWGHTFIARGSGKLYALRSLAAGSALLVWEESSMRFLGEYPAPGGHPCHIALTGREAVLSDYSSGTLTLFPLGAGGLLCAEPHLLRFSGSGPDPERQRSPHIHSCCLSPDGSSMVTADLGTDRLYRFAVTEGAVAENSREDFALPSGCGPRHCAFGNGVLYVATELSDEVLVLSWPGMKLLQRRTVNDARPGGGAHLLLSPDGAFLYVSSRHRGDGIAVFRTGPGGLLERSSYAFTGRHPRHFCLTPDGSMLLCACRDDDMVQLFRRDGATGALTRLPQAIPTETPVFVQAYEED